jgi:hypothetical protein
MISHHLRLIFVHIQKTAGTSVTSAFDHPVDHLAEKHFTASELRAVYGDKLWNEYFKFSFVRNPWDRLVSWWCMIEGSRALYERGTPLNNFQTFVLTRAKTFAEFLENCDQEIVDSDGRKWIYRNQLEYLVDEKGAYLVDFVGRFESLARDFEYVTTKVIGQPLQIPHTNRSEHRHYTEYYTPALAEKVARRYARDIAEFGYEFGA